MENQQEQSLVARRVIKDHILHVKGVTNINITRTMVLSARGARQWRFYVGARGHRPPKSCPGPSKFLDTVVLLLVDLLGSIVNFA